MTSVDSAKAQTILDTAMLEQYIDLVGPKLITDGLAVFEKMMPGYLSVLESNLKARDQKGNVEEGHKIKGAAGSVGLRHLQQLGQQIQSPDLPAWEDNVGDWVEEMKQPGCANTAPTPGKLWLRLFFCVVFVWTPPENLGRTQIR